MWPPTLVECEIFADKILTNMQDGKHHEKKECHEPYRLWYSMSHVKNRHVVGKLH